MIQNFHYKMLIGFTVFWFFMGFLFMGGARFAESKAPMIAISIIFSSLGLFASIAAGAVRSIGRRLDAAGIADDPMFPGTHGRTGKSQNQSGPQK